MSYVIPVIVADHDPDKKGKDGLPVQFRANINPEFPNLNYIASGQFNILELAQVFKTLKIDPAGVLIVDLRGEEHCFLNGEAVAYDGHQDEDIVGHLQLNSSVPFKPHEKFKGEAVRVAVQSAQDEGSFVKSIGCGYARLNVQDHDVPQENDIDAFIELIRARNNTTNKPMMYIHCHGGKGRTSQFAAMYVLMQLKMLGKLAPNANLLDVLKQYLDKESYSKLTKNLSSLTEQKLKRSESPTTDEDASPDKVLARIEFLERFLNYLLDPNEFTAGKSWSEANQRRFSF